MTDQPEATPVIDANTLDARLGRIETLMETAKALVRAVEGPGAPRWVAGPYRLKDRNEWAAFYVAVSACFSASTSTDNSTQQAEAVTDAETKIGRAAFRRIAELRASDVVGRSARYHELRALEAIVLAVTGEKG
jgi:hypothetical protein